MAHGVPALHPERRGQLDRSPRANWVEKRGGLPPYINSVATALERQGMSRTHAIQVAINTVKKACATGLWGGQKRKISGAIQAAACKAAAQWEAMKASASVESDDELALELAALWERERALELAWHRLSYGITDEVWKLPLTMAQHQELDAGRTPPPIEMAAGRAGLVATKVKVTNRQGTTFYRTMYLRPKDAARLKKASKIGTPKLSAKDAHTLQSLAKTPREKRPKGWQKAVLRIARKAGLAKAGPRQKARATAAKPFVKKATAKPGKTSAHAAAGLHRIGKKGNRYTDAKGEVYHRVGKGKSSKFVKGEPPKKKLSKGKRSSTSAMKREQKAVKKKVAKPKKAKAKKPKRDKVVQLANPPSAVARKKAAAKGQTFEGGRFPVRNVADLKKAIRAIGRAKPEDRGKIRAYIKRRAKALGATNLIPDSWS